MARAKSGGLSALGSRPQVITLEPRTLDQVFEAIRIVGEAAGRANEADELVHSLRVGSKPCGLVRRHSPIARGFSFWSGPTR